MLHRRGLLASPALLAVPRGAAAQGTAPAAEWAPTRPVRLVNPFTTGGPLDVVSRVLGERLSSRLGQPVVSEARAGAAGVVGVDHVAKSAPDGHTLLVTTLDTQINNVVTIKDLPYDPRRDFVPVTQLAISPIVLFADARLGVSTLEEFTALVRRGGRPLGYGSWGIGGLGHAMTEIANRQFGWGLPHAPYRGIGPLITDIVAGNVAIGMGSIAVSKPHADAGRLRYLAVSGTERNPLIPDVPTMAEAGLRDPLFATLQWLGAFAPARTPPAAVRRLSSEIAAALRTPEAETLLANLGFYVVGSTPEAFAALFERDFAVLTAQLRALGIEGT